jgi:hypothetical protein
MPSRARKCAGTPQASAPAMATLPPRSGSSPISARSVVVLPAPLRPISATRPPGGTCSETSRSTGTPAMSTRDALKPQHGARSRSPRAAPRGPPARRPAARVRRSSLRPDRHPVGEALHHVHVVLDEDGRDAGARSTRASVSTTSIFSLAATPEVGSSISSRRGFSATAMAMSVSLRAPSFSASARASADGIRPKRSSRSSASSRKAAAAAA